MLRVVQAGALSAAVVVGMAACAGRNQAHKDVVMPIMPPVVSQESATPTPVAAESADTSEAAGASVSTGEARADASAASPTNGADSWKIDPAHVLPVDLAGMRFWPGKGWVRQEPVSEMRAAEFRLPLKDWDPTASDSDAHLTVYYFGEQGAGDIEANLDRWLDQFVPSGDGPLSADISKHESNGLAYHILRVSGTYVAETSPGSGEFRNEKDWAMVALIIDSSAGPYYARFLGPRATIKHHEPGIAAMIDSIEPN